MLSTMRGLTEAARSIACVAAVTDDVSLEHTDPEVRRRKQALYDYLVPVVKGFSTECALEVTSLGIQVHGGMGFIEETGAAQFYRDARILTIYEGTTAIQANDLIGRKTLRDAGATALGLAQAMQQTLRALNTESALAHVENAAGLKLIHANLTLAVEAYESAVHFVLDHAKTDIRAVYAGSVPYLMLTGYVLGGWHLARAALVCSAAQRESRTTPFMQNKFATAVFYAGSILPRVQALNLALSQGAVMTEALTRSDLTV
jgi:hypothetical protein